MRSRDVKGSRVSSRYRKLAKKMHPDKNGGTEAAKQRRSDWEDFGGFDDSIICYVDEMLAVPWSRFQAMKERYEVLKKKLAEDRQSSKLAARFRGTECILSFGGW